MSDPFIPMDAKYPARCRDCGVFLIPGDWIAYLPAEKRVLCLDCCKRAFPPPPIRQDARRKYAGVG